MKLEIECKFGDFSTIVEWPEYKDIPGRLEAQVDLDLPGGDPGLLALAAHHALTRPMIGRKEGLACGHYLYFYHELGTDTKPEDYKTIEVTSKSALITHR